MGGGAGASLCWARSVLQLVPPDTRPGSVPHERWETQCLASRALGTRRGSQSNRSIQDWNVAVVLPDLGPSRARPGALVCPLEAGGRDPAGQGRCLDVGRRRSDQGLSQWSRPAGEVKQTSHVVKLGRHDNGGPRRATAHRRRSAIGL